MKDFNDEGNALRVQPISKGNVRDVNVPNHTQNAQLSNENNVVPQGYGSHTKQMNNQELNNSLISQHADTNSKSINI